MLNLGSSLLKKEISVKEELEGDKKIIKEFMNQYGDEW